MPVVKTSCEQIVWEIGKKGSFLLPMTGVQPQRFRQLVNFYVAAVREWTTKMHLKMVFTRDRASIVCGLDGGAKVE